jgi:hypothetical protein
MMPDMRQDDTVKLAALRKAIEESDSSGIANGNVFARVRRKLREELAHLQKAESSDK